MKPLLAAIVTFAFCLAAQDRADTQRKVLSVATLTGVRPISLAAFEIERAAQFPAIVHLKGSVEIRTPICVATGGNNAQSCDGYLVLRAGEADFHEDSGQIDARGEVRLTREK